MPESRHDIVFAYLPQRQAVESFMHYLGAQNQVVYVSSPEAVRGVQLATLINIANHPKRIPHDMMKTAELQGWIVIYVSDEATREFHLRRQGTAA